MHNPFSSFPSVDHLIEGVHYRIVDWNFADGQGCPEGEKMVFGVCRKAKKDDDWDTANKTKQEKELEGEAAKQKSDVKSNKPVTVGGKKYGWAVKGGKPVLVEWGSVAGEKKPPKPSKSPSPKAVEPPKPKPPAAQPLVNNPNPNRSQVRDAIQSVTPRVISV